MDELAFRVLATYPQIYYACHVRHPRPGNTTAQVTNRDITILGHLASGPIGIGELAHHMGLAQGTMSAAIQSLETRGFVHRARDVPDKRRVTLEITPAGSRVVSSDSVLDPERVGAVLSMLEPDEQARAVEGLALLAAAARRWQMSQPTHERGDA